MADKAEKRDKNEHDITYYATDSRLTEPSDGSRFAWRKMIERYKELNRPLTEEEAEEFRIN